MHILVSQVAFCVVFGRCYSQEVQSTTQFMASQSIEGEISFEVRVVGIGDRGFVVERVNVLVLTVIFLSSLLSALEYQALNALLKWDLDLQPDVHIFFVFQIFHAPLRKAARIFMAQTSATCIQQPMLPDLRSWFCCLLSQGKYGGSFYIREKWELSWP